MSGLSIRRLRVRVPSASFRNAAYDTASGVFSPAHMVGLCWAHKSAGQDARTISAVCVSDVSESSSDRAA